MRLGKKISVVTINNCFKKSGLFGEEPELLLTDTGTGELQAELTAVSASASLEEYLDADNIDLSYNCSAEDLNKKFYERVHTLKNEDGDESNKPLPLLVGVPKDKFLANVEELRTMLSLATTPELKLCYLELIHILTAGVRPHLHQAKLSFSVSSEVK